MANAAFKKSLILLVFALVFSSTSFSQKKQIKEFSNENYEVSYCKSYIDSNLIREGFYANGICSKRQMEGFPAKGI